MAARVRVLNSAFFQQVRLTIFVGLRILSIKLRKMNRLFSILLLLALTFLVSCAGLKSDKKETKVEIETSFGTMKFRLYNDTPEHRDNFIKLTKEAYFNELLFHRVIKGFMVQGGDPNSKNAPAGNRLGNGGPNYTLPAEIKPSHFHKRGVLSAARKGNKLNPEKRSSGSQFFVVQGTIYTNEELDLLEQEQNKKITNQKVQEMINSQSETINRLVKSGQRDSLNIFIADIQEKVETENRDTVQFKLSQEQRELYTTVGGYPSLDGEYSVFGEMIEGFDVLDKIAEVETDRFDRPIQDIIMNVKLIK